jgi:hypothetical protein
LFEGFEVLVEELLDFFGRVLTQTVNAFEKAKRLFSDCVIIIVNAIKKSVVEHELLDGNFASIFLFDLVVFYVCTDSEEFFSFVDFNKNGFQ